MADILPSHDRLEHVTAENLTRDEARDRARLLRIASYDVQLDLTTAPTGQPALPDDLRRRVSPAPSRARPPTSTSPPTRILEATLNGAPIDPDGSFTGRRLQLPALPGVQRAPDRRRPPATCAPARGCTGSPTRWTRRPTSTRSSRRSTRTGCSRASTSPTSRRPSRFIVDAPSHWVVVSNMPGTREDAGSEHGTGPMDVRADPAAVDVHHRARGRRLPRRVRRARRHPAGGVLPPVARRVPRRRRDLHRHQAGVRLLPRALRLPLPLAEVRPAVRPRVQRRSHGERRAR